jgi:hypothetical protein
MHTLLIAMTILGCDDSVTQCNYVASPAKHWDTIAQCDAESERRLRTYANAHYPTIIAVCQPTQVAGLGVPPKTTEASPTMAPVAPDPQPKPSHGIVGLTARAIAQAREMLPSADSIKSVLIKPVHFASTGYSWVATRLTN